jgi:tRNA 2-selenouridine synthase
MFPAAPQLDAQAFLAAPGPVLDTRSPGEFAEGHIPGAVSFPLFDDAERAEIGTLYKRQGRDAAVLRGLELVGPKMAGFVRRARALSGEGPLRVYCWRGGMRSGAMAWLLATAGLDVTVLRCGYKAYRADALALGTRVPGLLTLHGPTGSGKTAILHELAALGEQIVDLEALAGHRGSAFGGLGLPPQPATAQFQNELSETLRALDPGRRVWVEGESKAIGRCYVPDPFWAEMNRAPLLELELPRAHRVGRLVTEYGGYPPEALAAGIGRVRKRLGGLRERALLEALEAGRLAEVADGLLAYYDAAYERHREEHKARRPRRVALPAGSPAEHARALLALAEREGLPAAGARAAGGPQAPEPTGAPDAGGAPSPERASWPTERSKT